MRVALHERVQLGQQHDARLVVRRGVRDERATRRGHHMLAHLRTEAYPVYAEPQYPRGGPGATYEGNLRRIEAAKDRVGRKSQPYIPS